MNPLAALATLAIASSAPATTIVSAPQPEVTTLSTRFEFTADQSSTFECSLDGAQYSACVSPYDAGPLGLGAHTFMVRAVNEEGEADPQPPVHTWSVVAPPNQVPVVRLRSPARRTVALKRLHRLIGSATSDAGVKRVQVALTFGDPDRDFFPPRCWFIDMRTGELLRQACLLPRYTTVRGTTSWTYVLPTRVVKRIPTGRYELIVRAFNVYNQAVQKHFKLTLR